MNVVRRFAEQTIVPPGETLAAIERLLERYGMPPKAFEFSSNEEGSLWMLRVMCAEMTLRFTAKHIHNPRARLSLDKHRKRAARRLLRVALLVLRAKFEEMAGASEIGITPERVALNMPANFELENGNTLADEIPKLIGRTKWPKKIQIKNPTNVATVLRLKQP